MALIGLLLFALVSVLLGWTSWRRKYGRRPEQPSDAKAPLSSWPPITPVHDFSPDAQTPTVYRPFKPIYHITMALQSTVPDDLIVLDRNYRERVATRRAVIAEHPETVMGIVPATGQGSSRVAKAAVDEVYTYLMDYYLPARYPTVFVKQRQEQSEKGQPAGMYLHNRITGATFSCVPPADAREAFRILGETVEDDIFLLEEVPNDSTTETATDETKGANSLYPSTAHRAVAFLCCFPAGFDPASKLGCLLRDIHTPVPSYDKIGPSMERFFSRMTVGKTAKRVNWSVQTHNVLYAPKGNHLHEDDVFTEDEDVDISKAYLRVECQTVNRLPQTRAIFFSFKTYLFPIAEVKAEGLGPQMADAIEGLKQGNAPGMWVYKGGIRWGKSVCEYLRA